MDERKSFNKEALDGGNYNDLQWQKDFAEQTGIVIPDKYLFSEKGPRYAIDMMYEQNKKDYMQHQGFDQKTAEKHAGNLKKAALNDFEALLK